MRIVIVRLVLFGCIWVGLLNKNSFHLVDTRPPRRPKYGGRRIQQGDFKGGIGMKVGEMEVVIVVQGLTEKGSVAWERLQQQKRGQWNAYWQDKNPPRIVYNSSVDIRPEWAVLEQIPLASLSKLSYEVGEPEDITTCGTLEYYDRTYDRGDTKDRETFGKV